MYVFVGLIIKFKRGRDKGALNNKYFLILLLLDAFFQSVFALVHRGKANTTEINAARKRLIGPLCYVFIATLWIIGSFCKLNGIDRCYVHTAVYEMMIRMTEI